MTRTLPQTDDCRHANDSQEPTLKTLAHAAYELDAFKLNVTRAEADKCIAMLAGRALRSGVSAAGQ
jgi:hypothetical protein